MRLAFLGTCKKTSKGCGEAHRVLRWPSQPVLNGLERTASISHLKRLSIACSAIRLLVGAETLPLQLFQPALQLHLCRKIMKKLQHLFVAVVLTLVLSTSTFAGDGTIWTWVTEPTPTPTPVTTTTNVSATEGIIQTWLTSDDPVAEVTLSLWQSVLVLF